MNAADQAIAYALAQVGKPYQWGATGPNSFDCSGLVMRAYQSAGINLPRISQLQMLQGSAVTLQNLAPGDLCFPDPGHVQIYLGGNSIVEAPSSGLKVRVVPIWGTDGTQWTARRVTDPGQVSGGAAITTATTATTAGFSIPNPFSAVGDLTKLWNALWNAIKWPAKPSNWLRVAEFIGGAILIGFALHSFGVSVPSVNFPKMPAAKGESGAATELPELPAVVE